MEEKTVEVEEHRVVIAPKLSSEYVKENREENMSRRRIMLPSPTASIASSTHYHVQELLPLSDLSSTSFVREEYHVASPCISPTGAASDVHLSAERNMTSLKNVFEKGFSKYLKGSEIDKDAQYDFAIVVHRIPPFTTRSLLQRMWMCFCCGCWKVTKGYWSRVEKQDSLSEEVHQQVIHPLVKHGLHVDIVDAGFELIAKGGGHRSKYFVLLIRAPDQLVLEYSRKLRYQMWVRCGIARELETLQCPHGRMNPADRIQVVDHIVREGAHLNEESPYIRSMLPIHDALANKCLLNNYFQSFSLEFQSESLIEHIHVHFGEKVAYYFAFLDHYNKSLLPIAVIGVAFTMARYYLSTEVYTKALVWWGFLVSVVWSFWFLKSWDRRNSVLNFGWENSLHAKNVLYPNPKFRGKEYVNPVTGLKDVFYPRWRRYPKYAVVVLFMLTQIFLMMLLIAAWITIFEFLKVRFTDASFLSMQWCCVFVGGLVFGLFVDIVQWNMVVSHAGRVLTDWENWKTIEQYERALIRKLFIMDFLNYYTWFFLLAFVYVIPGAGDTITNFINSIVWNDPSNCCFGPHLMIGGKSCRSCPLPWNGRVSWGSYNDCLPCQGYATFDRKHLDLDKLFLTPIIVTQGLNLLLAVLLPWLHKKTNERSRRRTEKAALRYVKSQGTRKLLAEMEYREDTALLSNMSRGRYIENSDDEVEALNALAGEILFQSDQTNYDPYDDYHLVTVQYGFVVMFSMLWPLMPLACVIINMLKMRGDGFRLCRTLKRPFPRKASGIGEWRNVLYVLGCTGVVIFCALVFVSTGAIEFYSPACVEDIRTKLDGDMSKFRFGPNFSCFSVADRVVMLLVTEHILFILIWLWHRQARAVPLWLELSFLKSERDFKTSLYASTFKQKRRHSFGLAENKQSPSSASMSSGDCNGTVNNSSSTKLSKRERTLDRGIS